MLFNKDNIKMVEIDLTGTCNLQCPLCARNYKSLINQNRVKYNERDVSIIINQLDTFPNLNKINLVGATSEPTLYKKIFELIDYLNNRNIEIEICTNGDTHDSLFWTELGKRLKNIDSVYFTICGSTQELHEKYRKGSNLQRILNNADSFRESSKDKKIDYIQHILFDYNKDDLKNMIELSNKFSHVNWTKTYFTRDINIYKDPDRLNELQIYNDDLKYYQAAVNYKDRLLKREKDYKIQCESIDNNNCHIDQFGNIYPCYIFLEEAGQIWDMDYQKILDFKYDCCVYCEKNLKNLLANKGCELL